MGEFRAGFVALLGPPNAGKSSLLNALLGEELVIVSPRAQTTRSRILGILPRADAEVLFLDTPGRHRGERALNTALNAIVDGVVRDCDLALLLVDRPRGWSAVHDELLAAVRAAGRGLLVVRTKSDLARGGPADRTAAREGARAADGIPAELAAGALAVSARSGAGLDALLEAIVERLPPSPPLYGQDDLTDRPMRFLGAERIREAAIGLLSDELPHAIAVEIRDWDVSDPKCTRIRADLLVERESQKRIVVGQGGRGIKQIGIRARAAIEALVGGRVHLELFVKVDRDWSRSPRRLAELGYR